MRDAGGRSIGVGDDEDLIGLAAAHAGRQQRQFGEITRRERECRIADRVEGSRPSQRERDARPGRRRSEQSPGIGVALAVQSSIRYGRAVAADPDDIRRRREVHTRRRRSRRADRVGAARHRARRKTARRRQCLDRRGRADLQRCTILRGTGGRRGPIERVINYRTRGAIRQRHGLGRRVGPGCRAERGRRRRRSRRADRVGAARHRARRKTARRRECLDRRGRADLQRHTILGGTGGRRGPIERVINYRTRGAVRQRHGLGRCVGPGCRAEGGFRAQQPITGYRILTTEIHLAVGDDRRHVLDRTARYVAKISGLAAVVQHLRQIGRIVCVQSLAIRTAAARKTKVTVVHSPKDASGGAVGRNRRHRRRVAEGVGGPRDGRRGHQAAVIGIEGEVRKIVRGTGIEVGAAPIHMAVPVSRDAPDAHGRIRHLLHDIRVAGAAGRS